MEHRITFGMSDDAAVTAALTIPDDRATERIYEACDYQSTRKENRNRIEAALRRLGKSDRNFARGVLRGKCAADFGISRQAFCSKLKKICDIVSTPVNIGRKRCSTAAKQGVFS